MANQGKKVTAADFDNSLKENFNSLIERYGKTFFVQFINKSLGLRHDATYIYKYK